MRQEFKNYEYFRLWDYVSKYCLEQGIDRSNVDFGTYRGVRFSNIFENSISGNARERKVADTELVEMFDDLGLPSSYDSFPKLRKWLTVKGADKSKYIPASMFYVDLVDGASIAATRQSRERADLVSAIDSRNATEIDKVFSPVLSRRMKGVGDVIISTVVSNKHLIEVMDGIERVGDIDAIRDGIDEVIELRRRKIVPHHQADMVAEFFDKVLQRSEEILYERTISRMPQQFKLQPPGMFFARDISNFSTDRWYFVWMDYSKIERFKMVNSKG